jgi:hypothetical protein
LHTFAEITEEIEAQSFSLPIVPEEKEEPILSSSEAEPSTKNEVIYCAGQFSN